MVKIRRAEKYESQILTDIAIRSEAYWGYDASFMESFKSNYKVTEEFISEQPTFVLEELECVIGFYGLLCCEDEVSLEYLYVEPSFIGKGYGKLLWNHMVYICKSQCIKEVVFVTSPQAKDFYTKLGAVQTGEVESLVKKGRLVPKLIFSVENDN